MRYFRFLLIPVLLFLLFSCKPKADYDPTFNKIRSEIELGNIKSAVHLADSIKSVCKNEKAIFSKADSLKEIAERIALDFSISEEEINGQIRKYIGFFSELDRAVWENKGWLEFRIINDERKYFNRAASNLKLIRDFNEQKGKTSEETVSERYMLDRIRHAEEVIKISESQNKPVLSQKMKISYTLTVNADAVPEGEIIRCWLPLPKENHIRQDEIRLISTSEKEFKIAPETSIHRTIYMEAKAVKGQPAVFSMSFTYQSAAQYFNLDKIISKPYDKTMLLYRKYTSEQPPQIRFTPEISRVTDSITGTSTVPKEIVRKIYSWFKENITWTSALEYSIMPDIPKYVLDNKRGDCGMQTLLFISMVRSKGIPVRWQSGWMVPPGAENLHDWCEVYYEGTGWVPVDVSYDLMKSDNKAVSEFYMSGIDAYRMIINDGISGTLFPEKKYLRSEPYDFQRGEVEWKGGNLYFDKWDYDMKIEYLK
jgi:hypothetical protein